MRVTLPTGVGLFEGYITTSAMSMVQTGEVVGVEALLPEDFQRALAMLRG